MADSEARIGDFDGVLGEDVHGDFRLVGGGAIKFEKIGDGGKDLGFQLFHGRRLDNEAVDVFARGEPDVGLAIPGRAHRNRMSIHPLVSRKSNSPVMGCLCSTERALMEFVLLIGRTFDDAPHPAAFTPSSRIRFTIDLNPLARWAERWSIMPISLNVSSASSLATSEACLPL